MKGDIVFLSNSQGPNFVRMELSAQSGGQTSQALLEKEWNRRLRGITNTIVTNNTVDLGPFRFAQRIGSAKIGGSDQFYGLWTVAGDGAGFLAEMSASSPTHGESNLPDLISILSTLKYTALPLASQSGAGTPPKDKPTTPAQSNPTTNPPTKTDTKPSTPGTTSQPPVVSGNSQKSSQSLSGFWIDAGSSRLQEIALLGNSNQGDKTALMEEAMRLCGFDIVDDANPNTVVLKAIGIPQLGTGLTRREISLLASGWGTETGISEKSFFAMMQIAAKAAGCTQDVRTELQEWISDAAVSPFNTKRGIAVFVNAIGLQRGSANLLSVEISDGALSIPQFIILTKLFSRDLFERPAGQPLQDQLFAMIDPGAAILQTVKVPPPLEPIVLPNLERVPDAPSVKSGGQSLMVYLIEAVRMQVSFKPKASLVGSPDRMERTKTTVAGSRRTLQVKMECTFPGMNEKFTHRMGDTAIVVADKITNAPVANAKVDWQLDVTSPALIKSVTGSSRGNTNAAGVYALDVVGSPQDMNLGADAFHEDIGLPTYGQWSVRYADSPLAKAHFRLDGGSPLAQSMLREALAQLEWQGTFDYDVPFRDWHDKKFHGEITFNAQRTGDTTAGEPEDPKPTYVKKTNFVISAKFRNLVAKDVLYDASDAYSPDQLKNLPDEIRKRFEKETQEMLKQPMFLNAEKGTYSCFTQGSGYENLEESDCEVQKRTSKSINSTGKLKLQVGLDGPAYASIELDRKKMVGYLRFKVPYKETRHFITREGLVKPVVSKKSQEWNDEFNSYYEPEPSEKKLGGNSTTFAFPLVLTETPGVVAFSATISRKLGPEPKIRGVIIVTVKGRIHRPVNR